MTPKKKKNTYSTPATRVVPMTTESSVMTGSGFGDAGTITTPSTGTIQSSISSRRSFSSGSAQSFNKNANNSLNYKDSDISELFD